MGYRDRRRLGLQLACAALTGVLLQGCTDDGRHESRAPSPSCLRWIVNKQRMDKTRAARRIHLVTARMRLLVERDISRSELVDRVNKNLDVYVSIAGEVEQDRKCGLA